MHSVIGTIEGSPKRSGLGRRHAQRPGRPIRCSRRGLTLLTLIASLLGCAGQEEAPPVACPYPPAPSSLLAPTEVPAYAGAYNGDLEDYAHTLQAAIRQCSADKASALTAWPRAPATAAPADR